MINVIDAYKIAKENDKDLKTLYYSEYQDNYYFCQGDPDFYIAVNKNTGEAVSLNRTAVIFAPVFDGNIEQGSKEYHEHLRYCDELNAALNISKKIPLAGT